MNELDIIGKLRKIINNPSALNLNDDVFFDKKNCLLASIDTYNEKVHYPNFSNPNLIIKKVIRSSISDIICKGADPKYLLISFSGSKKHFTSKNINLIINSINQEQKKYNFSLIGGDTTVSNKSSFTICVFGFNKKIIKRNDCSINDDIYITGNIGDSSVGLSILRNKLKINKKINNYFISPYFKPNLPFGFHRELFKFASSSMDVSDGLLIDLKKLVGDKYKKFILDINNLPKSYYFAQILNQKKIKLNNHLFSGDDYQIIFTAKKKYRNKVISYARRWNQKITLIGKITNRKDNFIKLGQKLIKIKDYRGYIHHFI